MLNAKLKTVKSFLKKIKDGEKPSDNCCEEFQESLQEMKLVAKATSFRMAKQYNVRRPLVTSEILKVPYHIRGYAVAGAIDHTTNYNYLKNIESSGTISRAGLIQALEGWLTEDYPSIVAEFYCNEEFTLDKWVMDLLENAKWGDPARAAAKISIHNPIHFEWARHLVSKSQIGDPSNAMVDFFEKKLIHNPNYIVDFVTKDWVGCPSSAAWRLYNWNCIRIELFRILVKKARSGDPAKVVMDTFLIKDIELAKEVAELDVGVSSPQLALKLIPSIDVKWASAVVRRSKHATETQLRYFDYPEK